METRIILIRHGITQWNKQRRYCGYKDIGLSRQGRCQALKLRKRLRNMNFDTVYSSDRKRALETARIIFDKGGIIKVKDLREMSFGMLEGSNYKQIMKKYPVEYGKWLADPFRHSIANSEPLSSFRRRINSAIKKIIRSSKGKTIAIVCHGGTISIILTGILKSRDFWCYIPKAASISVVRYSGNKLKLEIFNDTKHLE